MKATLREVDAKLAATMISFIPDYVWNNPESTFLDISMQTGSLIVCVVEKLKSLGYSYENIQRRVFGFAEDPFILTYAVKHYGLIGTFGVVDALKCNIDKTLGISFNINNKNYCMKFDVVIGNPPYQNGNKQGGQNKIYNDFSKKSLEIIKNDGIVSFLTPVSVTRKSKRFSVINLKGLKVVDFSSTKYFSVGQTICSWTVDKNYEGDVKVICKNGDTTFFKKGENIFDKDVVDINFIKLHNKIRNISKDMSNRMFQRNNFGPAFHKNKDNIFRYEIFKQDKNEEKLTYYSMRIPHFYQKPKFLLRLSGAFKKENVIFSQKDYDMNYVACLISNKNELNNIESFLFSEYFIKFINTWKNYTSSKSYDLLVYLPKFDKTKYWSNDDVKDYFNKL